MGIRVQLYREEHTPAVKAFNARLSSHDVPGGFLLPESAPLAPDFATRSGAPVYREHYVALDEQDQVRGAFLMQHQQFWIQTSTGAGNVLRIGNYQMPISEGLIEKRHSAVAMILLRHALGIHRELFCLGMGSRDRALPRLLGTMGWTLLDIPFLFRVEHPARFLRHIAPLRTTAARRRLMDFAAVSGAGWACLRLAQARPSRSRSVSTQLCTEFGSWVDEIWEIARSQIRLSAVRSSQMLNILYPPGVGRFHRLKMSRDGVPVGWAVCRDTQMRAHRYFGDLRVGTIVDSLAVPAEVPAVAAAAASYLNERGVDLIVSNQGHHAWVTALRRCGFLRGPSNYIFAASRRLSEVVDLPSFQPARRLHITRADGDGPLDL